MAEVCDLFYQFIFLFLTNFGSPIQFHDKLDIDPPRHSIDPESLYTITDSSWRVFNQPEYREQYRAYLAR